MKYWIKNLPHRARGAKQEALAYLGIGNVAELRATVYRANGEVEDLGVLGRRLVTTIGAQYVVDCLQNLAEMEAINYHHSGTDATAENVSDTGLGAAVEASRVTGTQSEPASNQYRSSATVTYTGSHTVAEHGIFWASSGASTLFDRTVFTGIPVAASDSIAFQYTLTVNSGG